MYLLMIVTGNVRPYDIRIKGLILGSFTAFSQFFQ